MESSPGGLPGDIKATGLLQTLGVPVNIAHLDVFCNKKYDSKCLQLCKMGDWSCYAYGLYSRQKIAITHRSTTVDEGVDII
jgi:hypothetical protein